MKSKTWPLEIDHPEELIPRKISGAAQVKGLTLAFAILPTLNLSMALSVSKKGLGDINIRSKAQPSTFPTGERPQSEVSAKMSEFLAKVPDPVPSSTRGSWRGVWQASPEGAILWAMERKLSSYTTVTVATSSDPTWAWEFKVERKATWFAPAKNLQGFSQDLAGCIQKVIDEALDKVAEACTTRDTTRRNAIDQGYAEAHPPKVVAPRPSRLAKVAELPGKSAKIQKPEALASADCACKLPGSPPPPREEAPPTVTWKKAAITPTRGGIVAQPLPPPRSPKPATNPAETQVDADEEVRDKEYGREVNKVPLYARVFVAGLEALPWSEIVERYGVSEAKLREVQDGDMLVMGKTMVNPIYVPVEERTAAVEEARTRGDLFAWHIDGKPSSELAIRELLTGQPYGWHDEFGKMLPPRKQVSVRFKQFNGATVDVAFSRWAQTTAAKAKATKPATKPAENQVDADKDALLMNAFKEGIAAALAGSGV